MMELELGRLYWKGVPAKTMFQDFQKDIYNPHHNGVESFFDRLEKLKHQRDYLESLPKQSHERGPLPQEISEHDKAIKILESIALNCFYADLLSGSIRAIGFKDINHENPTVIPNNQWAFLKIDFNENSARHEGTSYHATRFIWSSELSEHEFNCIMEALFKNETEHRSESTEEIEPTQTGNLEKHPNNKKKPATNRTRITRLRLAVETAMNELKKKPGREPSHEEVIKKLEDDDSTGCVVDSKPGILVWTTTKGEFKETPHKAIRDMISRIKHPK